MKKEELKQARQVIKARRVLYHAEGEIDLSLSDASDIQKVFNDLEKGLPKHLRRTTFKNYHIHQVAKQWVRLDKNGMHQIKLDTIGKIFRDLAHRINQIDLSTQKGEHQYTPPSDMA